MTTKTQEKAAQGASAQQAKPEAKPEAKAIDAKAIDAKIESINTAKAKLEEITKRVTAREVLLKHQIKISKHLQAPELVEALEDEESNVTEVGKIVIYAKGDDRYNNGYHISNPTLCKEVLQMLQNKITTKLDELEIELLN